MDLNKHDFELEDLVARIKENDHRLVALQVPEGLKMQALEMMDSIEDESAAKVILAADPCYGACDLVHDKMKMMGVELVAHMGHSQMNIDSGMPTHFIPVTYEGDPIIDPVLPILAEHKAIAEARLSNAGEELDLTDEEAMEKFVDAVGRVAPLTGTKLGLVGSIQHLHLLFDYKKRFESAGFEVEIPVGGARLTFPGQVLGCNYSGDDPDIGHYLFLGSGDFHPIGLVMHTGKPLALLRRNLAIRMKNLLKKHGKKGYLLALDHVGPDLIDFYPVDAFVNTACPRIAIDDAVKYAKPLITPFELEVSLGEKSWEHGYQFDEIP